MDKVYLLLRNNVEAGPYTYEELLQQDLLPTDLIWIEGKSTMWLQPSELKEEKSVVPILPANHTDHTPIVHTIEAAPAVPWYLKRRSEEAELEAKAIALKEQAEAAALSTHHYQYQAKTFKPSKRNPVVYQEEEAPLLLEIHRANKKSVTLPQLIAAGVITALVTTGWYNRDKLSIVRPQASIISQAATPVIFQVIPPTTPKATVGVLVDTISTTTAAAPPVIATGKSNTVFTQKEPAQVAEVNEVDSTPAPQQKPLVTATEKKEEKPDVATQPVAEKKEEVQSQPDTSTEADLNTPAKKKGLGQAIKNIFKKKKKTAEDEVPE